MAISAAGQALAQKNKANREQLRQSMEGGKLAPAGNITISKTGQGVPEVAQRKLDSLNSRANGDALGDMQKFGNPNTPKVTDKFTKENFLKMSGAGTNPATTPTPLGTTNTSAGLNIVGAPHPSTIIQPGNTTGELPNTTITQTSGQTGSSSPFATGNGSLTPPPPKPTSTVGADVNTSIQDGIKQNQDAIKAEQDQLAKVKAANDAAISTKSTTTNDQVAGENAYANGMLQVNNQRMSDLNLSNAEYASEQERQKNQTLTTVQPLIDKERADNYAMLTEAKVKADNAEYNMEVQNDAALAQQNMAYASMGMTFTPSAINATRRLSTESSMKIAELKAGNAYKYAGLAKEMSKVEIAHQLMVNKVIADANDNILTKREKTRKDITDVQSNILLTEKEKVDKIAKLKNEYSTFRASTENLTLTQVRDSNKEVERRLNDITVKLDKDKTDAKQELVSLIKNGQWDKLSPQNKNKISKRSGLSLGEIEGEKTSSLYTTVNAGIQALIGKDFVVTPESSKKVYDLATSYMAMGDSVFVATQKAIKALAPTLKEFNESQTYQRDTRASKLATEASSRALQSAQIDKTNQDIKESNALMQSKIDYAKAQTDKMKAEVVKAQNDNKGTWTSTTTPDENGFILQSNKDGDIRYVEPKLQKTAEEWAATSGIDLLRAPDGTRVPGTRNPRTDGGSECGEFANNVTGMISVGETAKARDAAFQDTAPVAGGQAFFSGGKYDKTYGHVAIVTNVNRDKDGNVESFDVQESNLKGDGKVGTRTNIPVSEAKFYNKTELAIQAGNKKAFDSLDDMQSSPAKAIREVLAENPIDITKSGVNFQELQKVMGEVAKNYKDDKVGAKSALVQLLTTQGLIEEKYDIKDKEGTIKKLVDNKRIPVDKVGNKLREMDIQESSAWNTNGEYYTETDSKGNIKLFKAEAFSDELVAEFKAGS